MAPRPPIQAVINSAAVYDPARRKWDMALFNEDFTQFSGGGGSAVGEWVEPTLLNGWAVYSGRSVEYRIEDGGRTLRLRGTIDGAARTDEIFMDWPEGLVTVECHLGMTGFNPGVGYVASELAADMDGFHAWTGAQCAFLDGVVLGLNAP